MNLSKSSLFLGFPVDEVFTQALEKNKPEFIDLFIHSGKDYLQDIHFRGTRYLGKYVNHEEPLAQLELLEAHIFSMLKKLVVDYNYQNSKLVLFALPEPMEKSLST